MLDIMVLFSQIFLSSHKTCTRVTLSYFNAQPPQKLEPSISMLASFLSTLGAISRGSWMLDPFQYLLSRVWFADAESWHLILSRISHGMSSEGLSHHALGWKAFLESS